MRDISIPLRRKIRQFLLDIFQYLTTPETRRGIAKEAKFPATLRTKIDWGRQPDETFVDHFIEVAFAWLDKHGQHPALVEYLKATELHISEEHQTQVRNLIQEIESELLENPAVPERLEFVNRESELEKLTDDYSLCLRYAIHAPAGYGKSWLLERLWSEFTRKQWLAVHAQLTRETTVFDVTARLLLSCKSPETPVPSTIKTMADQFGMILKSLCDAREKKKGIVLLLDMEEIPNDFQQIVSEWLFELTQNIQTDIDFDENRKQFRVIICGRFFEPRILKSFGESNPQFRVYPLTPFDSDVIKQTVHKYFPKLPQKLKTELWTGLLHYTGGHPGCMSAILALYEEKGRPRPDSFFVAHRGDIQQAINTALNNIVGDIPEDTRELLQELSPYRYLSYRVLNDLLKSKVVENWRHAKDLEDHLKKTYLVSPPKENQYLFKDDISRRIMAIRLRGATSADLKEFQARCRNARKIYKIRLNDPTDPNPVIWAMEYLYQSLQMRAAFIHTLEQRVKLRQVFWGHDSYPSPHSVLYACLNQLLKQRIVEEQIGALRHTLENDWEFQFIINYFLREDVYEDKWFNALLEKITLFTESESAKGVE